MICYYSKKLEVKEEPSEVSFNECGDEIKNEPIDHKNVQQLPFQDNLVLRIPRCDDIMIEFECQDVKPEKNLLLPQKMNPNEIKKEPNEKLKEEEVPTALYVIGLGQMDVKGLLESIGEDELLLLVLHIYEEGLSLMDEATNVRGHRSRRCSSTSNA
ncbi:hypothetical protein TKK_0018689 [Trichogramma kaykai]